MRKRALHGISAPTSLSTRRRIGEFFFAARKRPISPPIEVPTQSIFGSALPVRLPNQRLPAGALARESIAAASFW